MKAKSVKVGSRVRINGEMVTIDAKVNSRAGMIVYFRNENDEYVWCFESEI